MSESAIKKLLTGESQLPVMPVIASRLLEFRLDGSESLQDITDILSLDVAVASTLLRYANSPAYNLGSAVETIERAVIIMGFKSVMNIGLSFSLAKSLSEETGANLNYDQFWKRSLIAATAARALGEVQREVALDELFQAALFQDIGLLALDRVRPGLYAGSAAWQHEHQRLCELEKQTLNFDHARFGAALLQQWGLHPRTVAAVMESHQDHSESEDTFNACVAASGVVADFFLVGGGREAYQKVSRALYHYFSIRDSQCMQLLVQIDSAIHDVASLYSSIVKTTGTIHVKIDDLNDDAGDPPARHSDSEEFEKLSRSDFLAAEVDLEGVMSRGAFENSLKNSFKMLRGQPMSVAFLSINNLKELEVQHGTKVAALLLRVISRKLSEYIRVEDFITRYGDCFAIILLGASAQDAEKVVKRIIDLFQEARYTVANGDKVSLSVNAGVAGSSRQLHFDSEQSLLHGAVRALKTSVAQGVYQVHIEAPGSRLMDLVG